MPEFNILLILDDGSKLPVHSSVLARCSPLFMEMANEGTLSKAPAGSMVTVPFTDCSQEEATSFLSVLYSLKPHKHINETTGLSIAQIGDKCGVKVYARQIHWACPRSLLYLSLFCIAALWARRYKFTISLVNVSIGLSTALERCRTW